MSTPSVFSYSDPTRTVWTHHGIVCSYAAQGQTFLEVFEYPDDTPLHVLEATTLSAVAPLSGLGWAAARAGTVVFVQQLHAPSFSVTDETDGLTLEQVESIARSIIAH